MATWFTYKCKKCGYEVMTEPSGKYMLMSGEYQNYSCPNCREIVSIKTDSIDKQKCPECGSDSITEWNAVKQGVINVEQNALTGGDVKALLDELQASLTK